MSNEKSARADRDAWSLGVMHRRESRRECARMGAAIAG